MTNGQVRSMAFLNQAQAEKFLEKVREDKRTMVMHSPKVTTMSGGTATMSVVDNLFFVTRLSRLHVGNQDFFMPQNEPHEVGVKFNVTPVAAADRRSVRLNFGAFLSNLESTDIPTVPVRVPAVAAPPTAAGKTGKAGEPLACASCSGAVVTMFLQQPKFKILSLQTNVQVPDGRTLMLTGMQTMTECPAEKCDWLLAITEDRDLDRLILCGAASLLPGGAFILVTPRIVSGE